MNASHSPVRDVLITGYQGPELDPDTAVFVDALRGRLIYERELETNIIDQIYPTGITVRCRGMIRLYVRDRENRPWLLPLRGLG